jgi:SAM-dependent methyltransferase
MTVDLACPLDGELLQRRDGALVCPEGHTYPVDDAIPIMLVDDITPTQPWYWATISESYPVEELELPEGDRVDPYVRLVLRGTCGNVFDAERTQDYPIPTLPLRGPGSFLDLGANWGRWTVAAARAGFDAIATDPSLGAIRAARRVAAQLGVDASYVVADARRLPFPTASLDVVFSYSVLQHFGRDDVDATLRETARVLKPGGVSLHQLPGAYGPRSVYQQARRGFRPGSGNEVRYWRPTTLRDVFTAAIGPTELAVDGFLTINPHAGSLAELRAAARAVVVSSRAFERTARRLPVLRPLADSLWVRSIRR